jgi:hypothetical protein
VTRQRGRVAPRRAAGHAAAACRLVCCWGDPVTYTCIAYPCINALPSASHSGGGSACLGDDRARLTDWD